MSPIFGNADFSGGLNTRDLGHLIAPNEATLAEGFNIEFRSVRTLDGDIRELIDIVNYPEIAGLNGSGGGVPNNEPILGCWRYYYNDGTTGYNAWVRVHGTTVEYWAQGSGTWVTIGAVWPNGAVPNAVQFENTIYIMHGDPAVAYTAKYLFYNGAAWQSGDAPVPAAPLANLRPSFAVAYKNRLYAVDTVNEPFRLRFSGINLPEQWNAPQGGYVTKGEDKGDPITGLFVHRDMILIFRRASVWRYFVDENGFEHIGQLHGAAGCLVHRSICAYKDAVYYASDEGMIALYGADSDCITHNITSEIEPHPDFIQYIQAVVHAYSGTLWVTYLSEFEDVQIFDACGDPVLDECGDPTYYTLYETDVWRADIRRPNIIRPRWVKLPYYRLTSFAMPPQSNVYKGSDWQNFHFCAQQPDLSHWNNDPSGGADPLYPTAVQGGPRHYNYRYGAAFDRDQVPAYNDACEDPLYAGDYGIGYWLRFRTPRYIPAGSMRDSHFQEIRLDYFVWKSHAAQGMDRGYSQIWVDETLLLPATVRFPTEASWWPIEDNTEHAPAVGGETHQEYTLRNQAPSNGKTLQMQWTAIGLGDRSAYSHAVEFRYFGVGYEVLRDRYNPED